MRGVAERNEPQVAVEAAVLADALLGGGLPPEAEIHLSEAGKPRCSLRIMRLC